MKYKGHISAGEPRIRVFFEIPKFKKAQDIIFMIDTGAKESSLSERDAKTVGLKILCFLKAKYKA